MVQKAGNYVPDVSRVPSAFAADGTLGLVRRSVLLQRSPSTVVHIAAFLSTLPVAAMSQTTSDPPNLAIPYITNHGVGTLNGSGLRTRMLRIQPTITLVGHAPGKVGVGLRLSGSVVGVDLSNIIDVDLEDVTTFGLTSGIELRVPIGRSVLLRPYADIGGVINTRQKGSETFVFGTGLLAELVAWRGVFEFGFEPRIEFVGSRSKDETFEEEYAALFLKTDVRHPLWFSEGRYLPSFGAYIQGGYYFNAIDIGKTGRITSDFEGGVSFGLCPAPKIILFRVPRVHIGYRTSNSIRGWRITFSDRMLRCTEDRQN